MKYLIIILLSVFIFSCSGRNDELTLSVPAEFAVISGIIIGPASDYFTAASRFKDVEAYADSHSREIRLQSVSSDNINYQGYSKNWTYIYASSEKNYFFQATRQLIGLDSISTQRITGCAFISHYWIDSNTALAIAENSGGKEFRVRNSDYKIEACLKEPLVPQTNTYWIITYKSQKDNSKRLTLAINAFTGELQ